LGLILVCLLAFSNHAAAQQPFATDNADVTALHRWHLESNNEFDVLPPASFPGLYQDTQTVKVSFGAFRNCEIGFDFPLIVIFNDQNSGLGNPAGLGDVDLSIKYNFRKERDGSKWPAFTVSLNIEPPTGSTKKQLGSGLTDVYLNGIFQKTLSPKNTLHVNVGATFAGNTATGLVGITTRGTVFTGGASFVRQFTRRLDLGIEIYGGYTANLAIGRGELEQQIGGNYLIREGMTLDFGFITGQAAGSPRRGVLIGFTKDF
jgi:Putative MetA-pathway of phenol degradation